MILKAIDRAINVKKGEFFVARAIEPSDKRLKKRQSFLTIRRRNI